MSSAVKRHDLYLREQERHSLGITVIPDKGGKKSSKRSSLFRTSLLGFSLGLLGTLLFASYVAVAGFLVRLYEIPLPKGVEHVLTSIEKLSGDSFSGAPDYALAATPEGKEQQSDIWNCNGKYTDTPVRSEGCIKIQITQSEDDTGNRFYSKNWDSSVQRSAVR